MGISLARLLDTRVPRAHQARLLAIEAVAEELGVRIHLVGGTTRDLLLGLPLGDLDLLVEGAAGPIAEKLAQALGCAWRAHPEFGTAEVLDAEIRIDVAGARSEVYAAPAALPVVEPATLEDDLARRDFTVNAMAIRLGRPDRGALTDLHGGLTDLEGRRLRLLHERSFLDDPTRLLRGARFESRLGFHLERRTEALALSAVAAGVFDRLSGVRWRHELEPLLELGAAVLPRLEDLGLLAALHPSLVAGLGIEERVATADEALAWLRASGTAAARWKLVLTALVWPLSRDAREELAGRLGLAGADRELLARGPERIERVGALLSDRGLERHRVERALRALSPEELVFVASRGPAQAAWVRTAMAELLPLKLGIRGADLVARGHAAGPALGRALDETRRARLDGEIGREEELGYAVVQLETSRGEDRTGGRR